MNCQILARGDGLAVLTLSVSGRTLPTMKSLELELPDQVAVELDELVRAGFYRDAQEAVCHALKEFLRHHASALTEQHQREDIAWALREVQRK